MAGQHVAARFDRPALEGYARTALLDQMTPGTPAPQATGHPLATGIYLGGLAGDVGTTAYGAATGKTEEANPLMKWAGPQLAAPLVAGTSLLTALLAQKLLKAKHPKLLKGVLMGMGGAHGAAAISNLHQMGR